MAPDTRDTVASLKRRRRLLLGIVDEIESFIQNFDINKTTIYQVHQRQLQLAETLASVTEILKDLVAEVEEEDVDELIQDNREFNAKVHEIHSNIAKLCQEHDTNRDNGNDTDSERSRNYDNMPTFKVKLPNIEIPQFDGEYEKWPAFRDLFKTFIHDSKSIPEVAKFSTLLSKLGKEPKEVIGNIDLSADGYAKAWEDLKGRYQNKRLIVDHHIKGLNKLPICNKSSSIELRKLLDTLNGHLSALNVLGYPLDALSERLVIHSVLSHLDSSSRLDWEKTNSMEEDPHLEEVTKFIVKRYRALEMVNMNFPVPISNQPTSQKQIKQVRSFANTELPRSNSHSSLNKKSKCVLCNQDGHQIHQCEIFKKLSQPERFAKVQGLNLCLNCLRNGHLRSSCPSKYTCRFCSLNHHTLLHKTEQSATSQSSNHVHQNNKCACQTNSASFTSGSRQRSYGLDGENKQVLLSTALVLIKSTSGRFIEAKAFLDNGSQPNCITNQMAEKLGLKQIGNASSIKGLDNLSTMSQGLVRTTIKSKTSKFSEELNFMVVHNIADKMPPEFFKITHWDIPRHIQLADPAFYIPAEIDILLGAETFWNCLMNRTIELKPGLPSLHLTKLGWIIGGSVINPSIQSNFSFCCWAHDTEESNLSNQLQKFWELEKVPTIKRWSQEEQEVEDHFIATKSREESGRYVLRLPVKESINQLGNSKDRAERQFRWIERKLNHPQHQDLKFQYHQFMNEFLELDHMKLINESQDPENHQTFYLPHHAVLKPTSTSTKCRVVFNGTAETATGTSLNQQLKIGPTVQPDIFHIILRARQYQFVMLADIEKMYRMVKIHQDDTKYQRILWRFNENLPLQTYELQTVTYGTSSAAYMATRALKQLAIDESTSHPIAKQIVDKEFYVDDVYFGGDSIKDCLEKQKDLISLLSKGGFKLRKWSSNHSQLLQSIPKEDREQLTEMGTESKVIKSLGLLYHPQNDSYYFTFKPSNKSIATMRTVLSQISQIYDPLGILSPIIITGKMFFQSLWALKIHWDADLDEDLTAWWIDYRDKLSAISEIKFNRCVIIPNATTTELHGFADAARGAYGSCIYVRSIDDNGNVYTSLMCAKSRVSPLSINSINRLELCGALLLVKLIQKIVDATEIKFDSINLWLDSQVALAWIFTSPHKLEIFEANRSAEIQRLSTNCQWRHVPTKENPADLISRGVEPTLLKNLSIWWHGPDFLQSRFEKWPEQPLAISELHLPGIRSSHQHKLVMHINNDQQFNLLTKFSSYTKLLHVTAYILRFINNCKPKSNATRILQQNCNQSLVPEEIQNAKRAIVKIVQLQEFPQEVLQLKNKKPLSPKSKLLSLHPFIDEFGIIRVGGRLENATISYDAKHPMLLPHSNHITTIITNYFHQQYLHAGPQLTLSAIHGEFWPIKGKSVCRKVFRNCITCFKRNPKLQQQIIGDLQPHRVDGNRAFHSVGIDLCGPFLIRHKHQRKGFNTKIWISVFVCELTKGIHLESVSDLSSETFLAALKRFISRRGYPTIIRSDNGTNFHGADNMLERMKNAFNQEVDATTIQEYCTDKQIHWKFIPPYSPYQGGLWEAAVKSVKKHLIPLLHGHILNCEEFSTLITQIEAALNTRPLWPLSDSPHDPAPLTPAHFMIGGPLNAIPEPNITNIPFNRLSSWNKITKLFQSFWHRFSSEYLNTLQQRNKWKTEKPELNVGDLVLVREQNIPPYKWPTARVINVNSMRDGHARKIVIQTSKVITSRAVNELCKIPISI